MFVSMKHFYLVIFQSLCNLEEIKKCEVSNVSEIYNTFYRQNIKGEKEGILHNTII